MQVNDEIGSKIKCFLSKRCSPCAYVPTCVFIVTAPTHGVMLSVPNLRELIVPTCCSVHIDGVLLCLLSWHATVGFLGFVSFSLGLVHFQPTLRNIAEEGKMVCVM